MKYKLIIEIEDGRTEVDQDCDVTSLSRLEAVNLLGVIELCKADILSKVEE